jgi:hypothetical protein
MSVGYGTSAPRIRSVPTEALDEVIILPDLYLADLGKAEKESTSSRPERKHLPSIHRKRPKADVPSSVKETSDSGLTGDSLDGNPLYGTTLE